MELLPRLLIGCCNDVYAIRHLGLSSAMKTDQYYCLERWTRLPLFSSANDAMLGRRKGKWCFTTWFQRRYHVILERELADSSDLGSAWSVACFLTDQSFHHHLILSSSTLWTSAKILVSFQLVNHLFWERHSVWVCILSCMLHALSDIFSEQALGIGTWCDETPPPPLSLSVL